MPSSFCPVVPFCLVLSCNPPQGCPCTVGLAGIITSIHHMLHLRSDSHIVTQSLYWLPVHGVRLSLHSEATPLLCVCV